MPLSLPNFFPDVCHFFIIKSCLFLWLDQMPLSFQGKIESHIVKSGYRSAEGMSLDTVRVLGVNNQPQSATVNSQPATVHYHSGTKVADNVMNITAVYIPHLGSK